MSIEIRSARPDEWREAGRVVGHALLHGPLSDDDWEKSEPTWRGCDSIIAVDGGAIVGHVGGYRVDTVVPGGATLPTSAVTRVGVLPTYTRRGLMRSMVQQLLVDALERGQTLASLRASQTGIYGRFGFGVAGYAAEVEIDTAKATPLNTPVASGSLRLLARNDVLSIVPPLYDQLAKRRPGALVRPPWMWERYLRSALPGEHDASHVVVHSSPDGTNDGFCHYEVAWDEAFGREPVGRAEVLDLWGDSPAVEAALWSHVLGLDLINAVRGSERPVDDLPRFAAADPRAYATKILYDEQWLRLLDVDAALAARTYAPAVDGVTVAVTDPWFPHNTGTWHVDSDGVRRSDDASGPDLEVGIDTLSAAYLGGPTWHLLHDLGCVVEHRRGAVAIASALFTHHPAPFCGSFF